MDGERLDTIARAVAAASRRGALRAAGVLAGGALLRGGASGLAGAECVLFKANGARCAAGAECCSGVCKRKRGTARRFCRRAPSQGTCTVEQDHCGGAAIVTCNGTTCNCFTTTRGRSFCGTGLFCEIECSEDSDCPAPGSACVQGAECCSGAAFCQAPCPVEG